MGLITVEGIRGFIMDILPEEEILGGHFIVNVLSYWQIHMR